MWRAYDMKIISHIIKFSLICLSLSACVTSSEPSGPIREGYLKYKTSNHFKAFAATSGHPGGAASAWGYASNRPSAKEAVKDALRKCKEGQARQITAPDCTMLYVGNRAVADSPVKDVNALTDQYQSTPAQFD
jgi:hypothetical protein